MTSSIRLVITPNAHQNWREILLYTWQTWGPDQQRDIYDDVIWNAFQQIRDFSGIGRRSPDDPREREYILESHIIVYTHDEAANSVTILRIVNPRRRRR